MEYVIFRALVVDRVILAPRRVSGKIIGDRGSLEDNEVGDFTCCLIFVNWSDKVRFDRGVTVEDLLSNHANILDT